MSFPYQGPSADPAAWVARYFPRPLLAALEQRGGIPHTVRTLITRQLAVRTPEQLRDRIERRWFQRFSGTAGPALLDGADTIAARLVEEPGCEVSVRCEDGWLLDEDANCTWCRPSGTEFYLEDPDAGRRSSPETVTRMAGEIRARMRQGRRSLRAATERARAERAGEQDRP
ncbi:hypothetical protein [Kitasatospora sp. NPDC088346]|uniref:hypothetical protein n=1 Tax=Kitasatospora sp. NPDC088346 TaxID=3364073 RepID=UPI0037FF3C77